MPITGDDDPGWIPEDVPAPPERDLTIPPELLDVPHTADRLDVVPPCDCPCCAVPVSRPTDLGRAPESLADLFEQEWSLVQQHTARAWRAAAAMHAHVAAERGPDAAEHVGAELALITNLHPRTGEALMITSVRTVRDVPELAGLVETGQLSSRHVETLLEEVGKWTDTHEQAARVLRLTLQRCRDRAEAYGWPTPAQLRHRLRTAAVLLDMTAADKHKKSVVERRSAGLMQTGIGQASLVIEGPDLPLVQAYEVIRARAEALGQLPGDTRTDVQRLYDAAVELLSIDADGGDSARPATGQDGEPLRLVVRGVEIAVLTPYSVTQGGNHELAEIPGFGAILPSTARELLDQAHSIRRVAIDAGTGEVIAVDDKVPGPGRRRPAGTTPAAHDARPNDEPDSPDSGPGPEGGGPHDDGPAPAPHPQGSALTGPEDQAPEPEVEPAAGVSDETSALLQQIVRRKVVWHDLHSSHYRVPGRLRRHLELRDRTCTLPGCHVPGRYCDVDHREEWPRGGTHDACHCLCRRHHRAKQAYFTVTLDATTGDTCWTSPHGRTYRRPSPRY